MKPNLILVPGLACDEIVWQHQVKHLQDAADIKVVDVRNATTFEEMLEAILNNAPKQFCIAGHSMGGWLAIEVAWRYPERVEKLCVLSSRVDTDPPDRVEMRKKSLSKVLNGEYLSLLPEIAKAFIYQQGIVNDFNTMLARNLDAYIRQQKILIERTGCQDKLSRIQAKTLLIHAAQDIYFGIDDHLKLLNAIPHAYSAIIEESGHMVTMEQPQAVTALMRYWLQY